MKALIFTSIAAVVLAVSGAPAGAMSNMSGMMMKPSCAAGDAVVGVNTMTKMYMTHDQMKMKMMGMSDTQKHAMMMKNHVTLMCMSKAKSMGAKMMHSAM